MIPGDIGLNRTPLRQVWGSSASSALHSDGACESSVRRAAYVQRRPSYALLGQPVKAIPAYRQAIAKGYSRKEVWNDPENAKLQAFPEFVKLVKSGTAK
jgi:hypothetical protein